VGASARIRIVPSVAVTDAEWSTLTDRCVADGRLVRSPHEDGDIMVRLTPMTPPGLDLSGPIAVDWRPGEVW
jgi:hypothetical protein